MNVLGRFPRRACGCTSAFHDCRRIVVTGGPGAGKTALLETAQRVLCEHVRVLPEAASIVYGGGFPRTADDVGRRAAQRAIYHVQDQLERLAVEQRRDAIILCDRGTIDGVTYWPDSAESYWRELGTTAEAELARYAVVLHLRTPGEGGYNHRNPLRTETAREAALLDARIAEAWSAHPRVRVVEQTSDFLDKMARALDLVRREIPPCCRGGGSL